MFRSRSPRRLVVQAAATLTIAGLFVAPTGGPAAADPPDTCTGSPLSVVVAGDSYTSGEGAGNGLYVPLPNGNEDFRHRSGYSHVHLAWLYLQAKRHPSSPSYTVISNQIRSTWGLDQLYFNPSSGAHSNHVSDPQSNGVLYNPPQLDNVDTQAQLAWFGLGGNDAGFADMLRTAYAYYLLTHVARIPPSDWQDVQARRVKQEVTRLVGRMNIVQMQVEINLIETLVRLPRAEIVVGLYQNAVMPAGNAGIKEIGSKALDQMYPFGVALNDTIRRAVAAVQSSSPNRKIHVFDPNTAGLNGASLFAGHELGQPQPYVNGFKRRIGLMLTGLGFRGMQESFHPNQFGTIVLGKALALWMAREFPSCFPNGADFNKIVTNPIDVAENPADVETWDRWAFQNTHHLCADSDLASLCNWFTPIGLLLPVEFVLIPHLIQIPEGVGTPVPGGHPGSGSGGHGEWTGIPAGYFPRPWFEYCIEPGDWPDDPPSDPGPGSECPCNHLRLVQTTPQGPVDVTRYLVDVWC